MVRYKTVEQFSRESGYTPDAIRTKIRDGKCRSTWSGVKRLTEES